MAEKEPKGSPRADFKAAPVFKKATIANQEGHKPGYVRQWFHKDDPKSRGFYGRYLQRQQLGNPEVGYAWAEAWTPVRLEDAKPGEKRDDDTKKGIETALTHGDLVCLETTVENFAVYQEFDRLRDVSQAKKLANGDDEAIRDDSGRAVARYRARVSSGAELEDHKQLLNQGA